MPDTPDIVDCSADRRPTPIHDRLERAAMARTMPHRTLSIAEDETWKDGTRLVAIKPVSNLILLEQASETCSASAWSLRSFA